MTTKQELLELFRELRCSIDHFVLKENGSFLGVVLSQEEYESYRQWQKVEAWTEFKAFLDKIHSRIDQNISDEELEKEIDEAIHEMRGVK